MSWDNLPAFKKTSGTPMVSASLRKDKKGEVKLYLFLSAFITEKLGDPETVDVQVGREEHLGLLRIVSGGETHKVANVMRGSKRVAVPWFEGLPKAAAGAEQCPIVEQGETDLVIRLPIAEWEIAISHAVIASKPSSKPVVVKSAAVPPPVAIKSAPDSSSVGPLDMADYLAKKGVKISRLAAGFFSIEGERVDANDVLLRINRMRKASGLPCLTLEQVK